jgi:hypothetical protein
MVPRNIEKYSYLEECTHIPLSHLGRPATIIGQVSEGQILLSIFTQEISSHIQGLYQSVSGMCGNYLSVNSAV